MKKYKLFSNYLNTVNSDVVLNFVKDYHVFISLKEDNQFYYLEFKKEEDGAILTVPIKDFITSLEKIIIHWNVFSTFSALDKNGNNINCFLHEKYDETLWRKFEKIDIKQEKPFHKTTAYFSCLSTQTMVSVMALSRLCEAIDNYCLPISEQKYKGILIQNYKNNIPLSDKKIEKNELNITKCRIEKLIDFFGKRKFENFLR